MPLSGGGKPFPVVTGPFNNLQPKVSPDGKWIMYIGNETGKGEIYVQDFPPRGEKRQISTAGGWYPSWRADGRELFYMGGGKLMAVEVKADAGRFEAGIPKPLFDWAEGARMGGVSADAQRFLLMVPKEEPGPPQPFTVVLNWQAGLKK